MKVREYEKIGEIYQWASAYTAESLYDMDRELQDFYETEEFMRIMFKAVNQRRGLIGILGLQGSGKTRILYELEKRLWKRVQDDEIVVLIKWSEDALKNLIDNHAYFEDIFKETVKEYAEFELVEYARAGKIHPKLGRIPNRDDFPVSMETAKKLFSKRKLREIREEALLNGLIMSRWILIDMPDYTKSTAHRMNRDIDQVQKLWQTLKEQHGRATFVIAFQKEMVMKHPHFFIGKMDLITLKPLTPEQLIEAYKLRHKTVEPFTEEALKLIAEYSRGIFRRFKKYIQITIEKNLDEEIPLTPKHVNKAITEELLIEDMELELSDIFKSKDQITNAVRILNYLRDKGEANMKTIANELSLPEKTAQRLIHKLHGYRYVEFKRGKGREIIVTLKL